MKPKTTCIRVQLKQAEKLRKYLSEKNLLRNDLKMSRDNEFVYFPVKNTPRELDSYKIIRK